MSVQRTHVATYRRTVAASIERIWENVLDWEHLPWLHRSSFSRIELLDHGATFWRARLMLSSLLLRQQTVVEVRLERPALRYTTRTLEGVGAGSEIVTQLEPRGERSTHITVEFHLAGVPRPLAGVLGASYTKMYTRLWDEDEVMMVRRQQLLDARAARRANASPGTREPRAPVPLGDLSSLRARLPLLLEAHGSSWRLVALGDEIVAHAALCPHLGGPLDTAPVEDGCITCPWHGYRFDVRSGRGMDGRRCRLPAAPAVEIDRQSRTARLVWPSRSDHAEAGDHDDNV